MAEVQIASVLCSNEKITTKVFQRASQGIKHITKSVAEKIKSNGDKNTVLILSSSPSMKGIFREFVRLHEEESLSFKNVVTFNLDGYYPLHKEALQSPQKFMNECLFGQVDINPDNIHMLDTSLPKDKVDEHCRAYEQLIHTMGVDACILGIERGGNIGFNEPGSSKQTSTRRVHLDRKTRKEAETEFYSFEAVPTEALTLGIGTVMLAKKVFLLAFGEHKAKLVKNVIELEASPSIGASLFQKHENAEVVLDSAAAHQLTRVYAPWTVIPNSHALKLDWTTALTKKAVIWLALKLQKSILRLREEDYINNHLEQLLDARGSVHTINLEVFYYLRNTITGWPGGKPDSSYLTSPGKKTPQKKPQGSTTRIVTDYVETVSPINASLHPSDNGIYPKRVIIFSPHPDDDVISMGGTFLRLVEQGHIVHVAYQTSGNIAVWDDDVKRFTNFASRFAAVMGIPSEQFEQIENRVDGYIENKGIGMADTPEIRRIKGLIRETEATAGARYCGVLKENIHFLNLPFYETGKAKKNPIGPEDVQIVADLLEKVQPHEIYAAGDLTDPHGTHRLCLKAIMGALENVKAKPWFAKCQVWLYRGAWQEWEPHEITMAVPMSPTELQQKRYAIFKHQSQKDPAPFPGSDSREFWQRSEARNRETAHIYDVLGLADYEAMEAFVLFDINGNNLIY